MSGKGLCWCLSARLRAAPDWSCAEHHLLRQSLVGSLVAASCSKLIMGLVRGCVAEQRSICSAGCVLASSVVIPITFSSTAVFWSQEGGQSFPSACLDKKHQVRQAALILQTWIMRNADPREGSVQDLTRGICCTEMDRMPYRTWINTGKS